MATVPRLRVWELGQGRRVENLDHVRSTCCTVYNAVQGQCHVQVFEVAICAEYCESIGNLSDLANKMENPQSIPIPFRNEVSMWNYIRDDE